MMKKTVLLLLMVTFILSSASLFAQDGATVGGHLKLTVYDRPSGEHNGVESSNYVGFALRGFYLYVYKELSEKVSVDIQPQFSGSTGATPSFGNEIAKKAPGGDFEFHGFTKAVIKCMLPGQWELSFGIPHPRFSWDYGAQLFWEDQGDAGKFSANEYLGAMHETGFELYKTFELGGLSLPFYFYVLNGRSTQADNNKGPSWMATIEPEVGPVRFKASLNMGKYDNDYNNSYMKWLLGAMFESGPFAVRGEYGSGTFDKSISDSLDAEPMGYYFKVHYRAAKWLRLYFHNDYVKNNYSGFFFTALGQEIYKTMNLGAVFYVTESSMLQFQYTIADWQQTEKFGIPGQEDLIKYNRATLTWRTTL